VYKNGGRINGIVCVNRPERGGRGLLAARQLYQNDPIFELPSDATMTARTLKLHEPQLFKILHEDEYLAQECGKKWGQYNTPCRLSLAVAHMAMDGVKSFWAPYFATIPRKPTSAVWWNDTKLGLFESPILAHRFQEYRGWHENHWETVGKHMKKTYPHFWGSLDYGLLTWATLVVETRAFSCPGDDMDRGSSTWCLVPYVDLINHQSYVGSEYGVDSYVKGWYQCLSSEAYLPGAELYISYGSHHHTAHFLETYGFAPGGFEHMDVVGFHVPLKDAKARKCRKEGGKSIEVEEYCPGDLVTVAGPDGCLGSDGKTKATAVHFIQKVAAQMSGKDIKRVTAGDRTAAIDFLKKAIDDKLASFSTPYEGDANQLVSGSPLSYDEYVVLAVRSRYKRVLTAVSKRLNQKDAMCSMIRHQYAHGQVSQVQRTPGNGRDSWLYEMRINLP